MIQSITHYSSSFRPGQRRLDAALSQHSRLETAFEMSGQAAMSLTLFTTTQSPLPVRYPRPSASGSLLLPPLIHRSLHSALDSEPASALVDAGARTITVPHPDKITKHDIPLATATADHSAHELTVKVHLVADGSSSERARWVEESLELLSSIKGLSGVDSLLVGFRGIDYKGKKSAASGWGDWGCGTDNPEDGGEAGSSSEVVPDDLAQHVEDTWAALEHLQAGESGSTTGARRLGTLYMPLGMLQRLADRPVPPRINAMDTPDCHHLPKEYSDFAASRNIELWAGGGGLGAGQSSRAIG